MSNRRVVSETVGAFPLGPFGRSLISAGVGAFGVLEVPHHRKEMRSVQLAVFTVCIVDCMSILCMFISVNQWVY